MFRTIYSGLFLFVVTILGSAQETQIELPEFSFEQLFNVEVTTVSKRAERMFESSAAIFVISSDEIRRSGCTSIAEILRMVPGIEVARIDANKWAITARGFNGLFANKLLVLIDGRSVYTPLFSGVFWEAQDVLLADVARIEVIRGPGATLWGANAVNGIINIITKSAKDTQDGIMTYGVGTEEKSYASLRYGWEITRQAQARIYVKYFNRDNFSDSSGIGAADGWHAFRGGFRTDWKLSQDDRLSMHGDVYSGEVGQTYRVMTLLSKPNLDIFDCNAKISGANFLTRWEHSFSCTSEIALQLYYDWNQRQSTIHDWRINTADVDFQHQFELGERLKFVWGLGYRFVSDRINDNFPGRFVPQSRSFNLFSSFAQTNIVLYENRLSLTLGSKFEHNDYTKCEIQPGARLLWTPHKQHTLWAALSKAVRTPSRAEKELSWFYLKPAPPEYAPPGFPPVAVILEGNKSFTSEKLLAYELGYRLMPIDQLFLDCAAFYNIYKKLRTGETGAFKARTYPPPAHPVISVIADNEGTANVWGVELAIDCQPKSWWRLRAAYTYLNIKFELDKNSQDWQSKSENIEDISPHHQLSLNSSLDLTERILLAMQIRCRDSLSGLDANNYYNLNLRLGWDLLDNCELYIAGQNLLHSHYPEFNSVVTETLPTEIERGIHGGMIWKF